jgi:hypothetical protein
VIAISADHKRFDQRDILLNGFGGHDGFTAKEVAKEVLGWADEKYGNSPKRANDLLKLGYIERLVGRRCRITAKVAHTFRLTSKGAEYLRGLGLSVSPVADSPVAAVAVAPVLAEAKASARDRFAGLRSALE